MIAFARFAVFSDDFCEPDEKENKNMNERQKKIVSFYAHDYRDMKMSEADLGEMLNAMIESLECDHQCTSNCRKVGCNCVCGEFHF